MPLINVNMVQGRTAEQKSGLLTSTTASLRRRRAPRLVAIAIACGVVSACNSSDVSGESDSVAPPSHEELLSDASVERLEAGSDYRISWTADARVEQIGVEALDDARADAGTEIPVSDDGASALATGLDPKVRWYFKITAATGTGSDSVVVAERLLPLEGASNFRDIGGYPTDDDARVAWGRLYRSDALATLTPPDVEYLDNIGVRLVCDLRTAEERDELPNPVLPDAEALHVPTVDDDNPLVEPLRAALFSGDEGTLRTMIDDPSLVESFTLLYESLATDPQARQSTATMLKRLADPASYPTIVHCSQGNNRTGWGTAVLLTITGVPRDVVINDYMLSNDNLAERINELVSLASAQGISTQTAEDLAVLLQLRPELLEATFAAAETEFGSFDGYLTEGLGLRTSEIEAIRENLIEQPGRE